MTVNWTRRSAKPHARGHPPAGVKVGVSGLPVGVTTAEPTEPLKVEQGAKAARKPSAAAAATAVVRRIKLFDYGSDSSKASVFWRLFSFLLRLGYTPRELLGNPNQKSLINGVIILLPGAFQISGCIAGGLVAARLTKRKP